MLAADVELTNFILIEFNQACDWHLQQNSHNHFLSFS